MEIKIEVEKLREKTVFVASPMYGGMCSGMYTRSAIDLATLGSRYQMNIKFFYLFNESLITRARNYLVDEFLRATDYDYLMQLGHEATLEQIVEKSKENEDSRKLIVEDVYDNVIKVKFSEDN